MLNERVPVPISSRNWGMLLTTATFLVLLGGISITAVDDHAFQTNTSSRDRPPTVLFLCPHGAAKSVLASAYFQQAAKDRGLNVRVEAAGTDPDEQVSPVVADHLRRNGYRVPVEKPRKVTPHEIETADVVISIGCDLTGLPVRANNLQKWDEVPGPGEDFKKADEAIRRRVTALVEELLARQQK
jgi:arsenate reductase (thioredoxin)